MTATAPNPRGTSRMQTPTKHEPYTSRGTSLHARCRRDDPGFRLFLCWMDRSPIIVGEATAHDGWRRRRLRARAAAGLAWPPSPAGQVPRGASGRARVRGGDADASRGLQFASLACAQAVQPARPDSHGTGERSAEEIENKNRANSDAAPSRSHPRELSTCARFVRARADHVPGGWRAAWTGSTAVVHAKIAGSLRPRAT